MSASATATGNDQRVAEKRIPATDVVVLVPGFLGFARFGGFYYFADRVVAVLRGLLEESVEYPVPVVPCTTLPTHGLADRQRHLLDYLDRLSTATLSGVERIHLVGHSTGGVDAQLLGCTKPVEGRAWDRSANGVRRKIASVITIAAPHYGTRLADSWLAYWGENPLLWWGAYVPEAVKFGYHVLRLIPQEAHAIARLRLAHPRDLISFLGRVAFNRQLITALRPEHMEKLRATLTPEPGIPRTCFVTATEPRADGDRPSDPFFKEIYGLTRSEDGEASPAVQGCIRTLADLIKRRPDLVICSDRKRIPSRIDAGLNDGVVNTARQLIDPNDPSQVGGFVVADHADVLGHYDRQDSLIEGEPYNAGLFHSGAGFGDDEFFGLYRRVAQAILKTIPRARREEEPEIDVVSIQPA
jgi:pimeloyl-ACP methyl ester carboxylesterase